MTGHSVMGHLLGIGWIILLLLALSLSGEHTQPGKREQEQEQENEHALEHALEHEACISEDVIQQSSGLPAGMELDLEAAGFPELSLPGPGADPARRRVFVVSDPSASHIHRFYDSSAFSPSGRYLAMTRVFEDGVVPRAAKVVVVDLHRGPGSARVVAETLAWDSQTGAHVQWGASDAELVYNTVGHGDNVVFGVVHDISAIMADVTASVTLAKNSNNTVRALPCSVYHVSVDGRYAVSPDLRFMSSTQLGYGMGNNNGATSDMEWDVHAKGKGKSMGLLLTDMKRSTCTELVSLATIEAHLVNELISDARLHNIDSAHVDFNSSELFGFHARLAPKRGAHGEVYIMFVVRQRGSFPVRFFKNVTVEQPRKVHRLNHLFVVSFVSPAVEVHIERITSWSSSVDWWRHGEELTDGNHPNWVLPRADARPDANAHTSLAISMNTRRRTHKEKGLHGGRLPQWWNITIFTLAPRSPGAAVAVVSETAVFTQSSGHPTVMEHGTHMTAIVDASSKEGVWFDQGSTPLRFIKAASDGGGEVLETVPVPLGAPHLTDVEFLRAMHPLVQVAYLFTTHYVPMAIYNMPWRSSSFQRRITAWRCDAHPSISRQHTHVAVNARHPRTHNRVVAVMALPDMP